MNQRTDGEHGEHAGFSVVTYNVLAQAYVRRDRYPRSPEHALEAGARRRRLLDRIADLDADILCLQEVEPDAHAAIAERLGDAYVALYEGKRGRPDGASVLVRRARFRVRSSRALHYEARERGDDQLALIVDCEDLVSGRALTIACTHLRWQGREVPEAEHLGRLQLLELLALRPADATWIIAGDLNALSQSVVLEAALMRGFVLSCRAQRPWDTVNIGGRRRKLDYLLIPPQSLSPRPCSLPRLERDTPMPSRDEPSDHLPLRVEYRWRADAR
ncbi:MAG: endonuclease/exonuclease/phosphatase family protein [Myxococcales bacterium]|nr:endonuclease/exonuclease/phosphatase family protein [Myxococcales bacterium]MCB9751008.1 endonuclease/exonuclease/phosphatase family protein [Myxococcales bacterium]